MTAYVEARRAEGVHRFQLKLGSDPHDDARRVRAALEATTDEDVLIADANGGWRLQDAVVAARLLDGLDRVFFEQPCPTLEECLYVRQRTTLPMVLDEVITDVPAFLRAFHAGGMEAINLKISRVGGLTRAREIRSLAEALGIRLTIEDTWGGDVVTAAVSHLAASVRPEALFTVSFMNDWTNEHVAGYEPRSAASAWAPRPTGRAWASRWTSSSSASRSSARSRSLDRPWSAAVWPVLSLAGAVPRRLRCLACEPSTRASRGVAGAI